MNEHSFSSPMASSSARKLAVVRQAPAGSDKRDAILRAATKVFAQNGYFQSQVADVARVAGVAAGTVYLYFRSKDDLLVSIFERSMSEALAEGRAALARRRRPGRAAAACWPISISNASAATRSRRGVPGRAAPVDEVHGAVLRDLPAGLLQADPRDDRRRPAARRVPQGHQRDDRRPRSSSARSTRWRPTGC